ncbi:efflux transporter outer membrane subunit [Undibacterium sp. WLHG33]|uniref:efflux transporter outer membrane subunit n=1 Tax=Undibacterium sp. WLHG33 TaxID=3412482 RepID=UPI003C2CCDDD
MLYGYRFKNSRSEQPHTVSVITPASTMILMLALLTGCAVPLSDYQSPVLPVADAYPAVATSETGIAARQIGWETYFTDPVLRHLITLALANNLDVRTALLRVQEMRAAYGIQRADSLPTFAGSLDATRTAVPGDLNVSGRPVIGNQFQLGIGFSSWEIDFWGRVSSLNTAALETYLASDASRRATVLSLITQVANTYLALRETDERLILAQQTVVSRAESLRIFRRRVDLGATSRLELTQVELLSQQAMALKAQLEQTRASQINALTLLVGVPLQLPPASDQFNELPPLPELQAGVPSDLLLQRPDVIATEHALQAAQANIVAARAAFFPRISLTAFAGTASAELDRLFSAGSQAWTFSPGISLPLFDSGRREAASEVARLRREQAVARYEQTVQSAFRDVADALSARHWLAEQEQIARATLSVQTERARLAKLRYDHGSARYLEVLDAERDLLSSEQQLVQIRRASLSAQVALFAALGGGSQLADEVSVSSAGPASARNHNQE